MKLFFKLFTRIDGYIEDQIFYLSLFWGISIFILYSIDSLIFSNFIKSALPIYILVPIVVLISFAKLMISLFRMGFKGLLILNFFANYRIKFTGVYIECLLILVFLSTAYYYLLHTNSDGIGLFITFIVLYKTYISVIINYLGKIVLNKKVENMYSGKVKKLDVMDTTFHETIFLLDHLKEAMDKSLNEKLKSEKLKTELITNISHDIKTPLTSIINYVDLLKSEQDPEERQHYLQVLEMNSKRLKTMVVDLIDASKTGTGNIELKPTSIELNELMLQVYGQFDKQFEDNGLEFIFESSRDNIYMIIDGDQLSRVIENLFGNVVKYSLKNSRVYGKTNVSKEEIRISLKNTSEQMLNVDPDELMQQFVRGERSRHSEGSGLGLYIARNIIEHMGGEVIIDIDGDLFTISIVFRIRKTS